MKQQHSNLGKGWSWKKDKKMILLEKSSFIFIFILYPLCFPRSPLRSPSFPFLLSNIRLLKIKAEIVSKLLKDEHCWREQTRR